MLGINHTTTAVLIAVTVKQPEIAVPLALASHFVLDVIPHHGEDLRFERGSANFWPKVAGDALLSLVVVALAVLAWPHQGAIITACALAAILPDLLWPVAWHVQHKGPLWTFFKFHKGIQHESPKGIWVEYLWVLFTGAALLIKR